MQVIIGPEIGFSESIESLNFGNAPPGSTIIKSIDIENTKPYDVNVKITLSGNISKSITVSENNFLINTNEKKKVNFTLTTIPSTRQGNYTGTATVFIKKKY